MRSISGLFRLINACFKAKCELVCMEKKIENVRSTLLYNTYDIFKFRLHSFVVGSKMFTRLIYDGPHIRLLFKTIRDMKTPDAKIFN